VEARLKVLRDLPITNNEIFSTADNNTKIPMETIRIWSINKDSITAIMAPPTAGPSSSGNLMELPLSLAQQLLTSPSGQLTPRAAAQAEMVRIQTELQTLAHLPIVNDKAQADSIPHVVPSNISTL
jgi:hypothetical protein